MRVLLLSLMFPPHPGGGVRRVGALAKHLPRFGYEVETLAALGGADHRFPSIVERSRSLARRLRLGRVHKELSRLLVPDAHAADVLALVGRALPLDADLIIASGPPPSILVAGAILSKLKGVPWVADLRDPWIGHPHRFEPTRAHAALDAALEREVLGSARLVWTATRRMAADLESRLGLRAHPFLNGYDPERFAPAVPRSEELVVGYYGSFYRPIGPAPLVRAVAEARAILEHAGPDYDGELARAVREHAATLRSLGTLDGAAVVERMKRAAVLALVLPDDPRWGYCRTQKLAEYLASGRPILCLTPPCEAGDAILAEGAGEVVPPSEPERAAEAIRRLASRPSRPEAPRELTWSFQVEAAARTLHQHAPEPGTAE